MDDTDPTHVSYELSSCKAGRFFALGFHDEEIGAHGVFIIVLKSKIRLPTSLPFLLLEINWKGKLGLEAEE